MPVVRDEELIVVRWRSNSPDDHLLHEFLLLAADVEIARTLAEQILERKGRVCDIGVAKPRKAKAATAR